MKICGLAVFCNDKFVGELTSLQSLYHLILSNEFSSTIINIPSPFSDVEYVSLYLTKTKSKNKVKVVNDSPYITCDVSISARVLSSSIASNYLTNENIIKLQDYANSYFKANFLDYLYKTSIEYKSDIVGFGKYAVKNFSNLNDWKNFDWLNNYSNTFFNVTVNTKVLSSYLVTESNKNG